MTYLDRAYLNFVALFVIFSCCAAAHLVAAQSMDVANLIQETSRNTQNNAIADYAYKFSFSIREIDKKGMVKKTDSLVYETFVPSRLPHKTVSLPMIKLEENGKPLSFTAIESQRKKAAAKLEEIARQAERDAIKPSPAPLDGNDYASVSFNNGSVFSNKEFEINILQILQGCEFSNLRTEMLNGRETILLDFTTRPNFAFKDEMRYFSKIKGTIWIDAADKKLARLEGYPSELSSSATADKNTGTAVAAVIYEQVRVPEGFWFFQRAELNSARYPNIFGKNSFNYEMNYSDYKRFRSEIKILDDAPGNQ